MVNRVLFGLLISTMSMAVLAEPTFFGAAATPTARQTPSRTVMSPAEFNSQVSQITAKKQAAFKEQLNQQLAQPVASMPTMSDTKQPATPKMATPPPPPIKTNVYTGFGGGDNSTTNGSSTPPSSASPTPSTPPPASGGGGGWNIRY